uniref:Serpin domain-containing protein n=1 Tax=Pelusios castaneus TaxID=367368 RepID=A0A8C8S4T1_9SAUR
MCLCREIVARLMPFPLYLPFSKLYQNSHYKAYFKIVLSNVNFAFKFYTQVISEAPDKNIFFSPISISTAFAMLTLGAKSATLNQIQNGLALNLNKTQEKEIHEGFCYLIQALNRREREIQVNMGNGLFLAETLKPLKKFLEDVKNFYDSEVFPTDFSNCTSAVKQINNYIEKKTHGKVVNLIEDLDPFTVMILINYVLFKGKNSIEDIKNTTIVSLMAHQFTPWNHITWQIPKH